MDRIVGPMKTVVAALAGPPGSGTAALGARMASILNWPFASFGSYVRAQAASRRLLGTRKDLQDTGLELKDDAEGFCRAVIAQSFWRPGQPLVVDGLRHPQILESWRRLFYPIEVIGIFVEANGSVREERLRKRGEIHPGGIIAVDEHPVEKEIEELRQLSQIIFDGALPEASLVNQLLEYLLEVAEIAQNHSWVTNENLLHVPAFARQQLALSEGDLMEVSVQDNLLIAKKIVDVDRMRSVFGRMRHELAGVDPVEWLASIRGRGTPANRTDEIGY